MKKRAILCLLLIVALAFSLLPALAFADESKNTGSVYAFDEDASDNKGDKITANKGDGYYYTDGKFLFEKGEDATFYEAAIIAEDSLDGLTGEQVHTASTAAGQAQDTLPTYASDDEKLLYIGITEGTEKEGETTYSAPIVVCYDTTKPQIDAAKFNAFFNATDKDHSFYNLKIAANKSLQLPTNWMKEADILIESTAQKDEDGSTVNDTDRLTVKIEYCDPSDYFADDWSTAQSSGKGTISATTFGWWKFRFVVSDLAGNSVTSPVIERYVTQSGEEPEITVTEKNATAGAAYTIPTPSINTIGSVSSSYTYTVSKLVNNAYIVIYDSATKKVTEGYEKYVSEGTITPAENEYTREDSAGNAVYMYKVNYFAKDEYGNEASKSINITVNQADTESSPNVLRWIFLGIAILSAVGILIVALFVKPKDEKATANGRVVPSDKGEDDKKQ